MIISIPTQSTASASQRLPSVASACPLKAPASVMTGP